MSELSGSLAGIGAPAILRFLAGLGQSGRLHVWDGRWAGEVILDGGQVTGATFGAEQGLDALEALVLCLPQGQFAFATGAAVPDGRTVQLPFDDLVERLARLEVECAALALAAPLPAAVPRPAVAGDRSPAGAPEQPERETTMLSVDRRALQVCLAIDGRRTVEEIAASYGLAQTAKVLSMLVQAGMLELASSAAGSAGAEGTAPGEAPSSEVQAGSTNGQGQAPPQVPPPGEASLPPSRGQGEHPLRYWLRPLVLAGATLALLLLTRWQAG